MTEQIGVVDKETRLKTKVEIFKDIVEKNLDDVAKPSLTATSKMKVERYRGGFVVFYEQALETGDVFFTIEEPFSGIDFEFSTEEEGKIRRSINTREQFINVPEGVHDILDVDVVITTRLLTEDEIDDLLLFALNPKSIAKEGPPASLVSVDPHEDKMLMDCEIPTWNLPKQAA